MNNKQQLASCNNMQNKMISHNILGYNPFTVEFVNHSTGTTVVEKYAVVLTKKEIEVEYDYVSFPPNKLQQLIELQNECELNSLENQTYEG